MPWQPNISKHCPGEETPPPGACPPGGAHQGWSCPGMAVGEIGWTQPRAWAGRARRLPGGASHPSPLLSRLSAEPTGPLSPTAELLGLSEDPAEQSYTRLCHTFCSDVPRSLGSSRAGRSIWLARQDGVKSEVGRHPRPQQSRVTGRRLPSGYLALGFLPGVFLGVGTAVHVVLCGHVGNSCKETVQVQIVGSVAAVRSNRHQGAPSAEAPFRLTGQLGMRANTLGR